MPLSVLILLYFVTLLAVNSSEGRKGFLIHIFDLKHFCLGWWTSVLEVNNSVWVAFQSSSWCFWSVLLFSKVSISHPLQTIYFSLCAFLLLEVTIFNLNRKDNTRICSLFRIHFYQFFQECHQIIWIVFVYTRKVSSCYFFVQSFHIPCSERWFQIDEFIQNASQWPNIRFWVIGFIVPNLGTGIVRSTSLSLAHSLFLDYFRDIHIP